MTSNNPAAALALAALALRQRHRQIGKGALHLAAHHRGECRSVAFVGDMYHINASGTLEHLAGQVRRAAIAERRVVEFARVRAGELDEIRGCVCG